MGFDKLKFLAAGFQPREGEVKVPALAEFFPEGAPPVWKVRGLKGVEVARANAAEERHKNVSAVVGKLVGGTSKEKVDAIAKALGYDEATPGDIIRRIELLQLGSMDPPGIGVPGVQPVVDTDVAARICEFFPVEFFQLTNEILLLTGKGHVPGKQKASGGTQESKAA